METIKAYACAKQAHKVGHMFSAEQQKKLRCSVHDEIHFSAPIQSFNLIDLISILRIHFRTRFEHALHVHMSIEMLERVAGCRRIGFVAVVELSSCRSAVLFVVAKNICCHMIWSFMDSTR